ncbi:MAG: hypothetical protein P8Y67_06555 [Alphaproteobacteria bacterium]|jgi:hypothetical protein
MITTQEVSQSDQRYVSKMSETQTMPEMSTSDTNADPKEVAEYLAEMLCGVREMANSAGLTFLAYLVQVAIEEAKIQAVDEHHP